MSFGQFLLEEGIEVEVEGKLEEVLTIVDTEVPNFSYNRYRYAIDFAKASVGFAQDPNWKFLVKPYDSEEERLIDAPICVVEVDGSGPNGCVIKIPSRHEWSDETGVQFDQDGEYFTSFIFQFLNTLQNARLITLPGHLPVA